MISHLSLVVALGNPGYQYQTTRHNIAWQLIGQLSFFSDLHWNQKFKGIYASYILKGEKIWFLKPMTYMNRSGESLSAMIDYFKIDIDRLLIIHDELELNFGVIGFKEGGGLAGHNGLRSIAASLGTVDFKRLRMGISRPAHSDITSYVLSDFSEDEEAVLPTYLEKASEFLELSIFEDFGLMVKRYKKENLL
jgi:PTH1 family peptidyl-tRNA hydrolase